MKQGENELATQPPRQAVPPQSNKQKQESRERGWHSTGIVALREQNLKELPATVFAVSAAKVRNTVPFACLHQLEMLVWEGFGHDSLSLLQERLLLAPSCPDSASQHKSTFFSDA